MNLYSTITELEIRAADFIILYASMHETTTDVVARLSGTDNLCVKNAAAYLKADGFIEISMQGGFDEKYKLLAKGINFQKSKKKFEEYLEEQELELRKQVAKDQKDDQHKNLQIEKLEIELKSLKAMQDEQRKFWQSGMDRDNRQRWQYWLTLILAVGGFLLGIINFLKDILLRK